MAESGLQEALPENTVAVNSNEKTTAPLQPAGEKGTGEAFPD